MKNIEVVAAVICENGKILAAQRGYGEFKDGWEFPGGKMEKGESAEQALIRELREELTVTVEVEKLLMTVEYDYPAFHLTMHCFLTKIISGKINLLEHEAMKWLSSEDINSVEWLPADIQVVEYLKEHVLKHNHGI
ncbi:MAG: (deoxy)nucleoside triphosphate pyrophosphohydrolase [Succinatimonas sp.]|nr:(deoxy)nucleoside triphosphate pyrophosphohydrolase [Succinatimonas sp.]